MKKLRVTVDGKSYEVQVEELESPGGAPSAVPASPASGSASVAPPPSAAPRPSAPVAAGSGQVVSPLAGRVVAVNCAVGDAVEAGATLITLEAMKMNTFVTASVAGTVKEILTREGDAVEEGRVLVTLG